MGFSTIGGAGGGSAETPSGGAGSAEHAGVEDNSSSNVDQIQINDASVVINKDLDNCDFVVKGDTAATLLVCDASADKIGVGTASPSNLLTVTGAVGTPVQISTPHATDGTAGILFGNYTVSLATNQKGALLFERDSADGSIRGKMHICVDTSTDSGNAGVADAVLTAVHGGNVGIGTKSPDSLLEVADDGADTEVLVSTYSDTPAHTPKITFRKADNTEASPALVDDDDVLGVVDFLGHDGVNFERGAKIEARVDGTAASNDLPTELTFWTTPDGSATCAERLSIKPDGRGVSEFTASVWANVDGEASTPVLRDDMNASTITDDALGILTVNFTNNLADVNYAPVVSSYSVGVSGHLSLSTAYVLAVDSVQVSNRYTYAGVVYADANFYLVILGGV